MISFFKKKEKNHASHNRSYLKIAALLIHAAKIDETYEENEKKIIKKTLIELGASSSNIVLKNKLKKLLKKQLL